MPTPLEKHFPFLWLLEQHGLGDAIGLPQREAVRVGGSQTHRESAKLRIWNLWALTSSDSLLVRGGIPRYVGHFLEIWTQRFLIRGFLVCGLAVAESRMYFGGNQTHLETHVHQWVGSTDPIPITVYIALTL